MQPSEGISELYSHLKAHNKLLIRQHAVVVISFPSSPSKIHMNDMRLLYRWCLETNIREEIHENVKQFRK